MQLGFNLISSGPGGHAARESSQQVGDGLVGDRIDTHVAQFLLHPRVPVILDVIVCAPRQSAGNQGPSAHPSMIHTSELSSSDLCAHCSPRAIIDQSTNKF